MKIMLVDDSRTMRNIQKNVLAQLGHKEIVEAADGEEALKVAEAESPELILLDWNMPKMDGLTFLKNYRLKDKTTPIIMVTTEAEKSRVIEAIKAGVNNYVIKPFTPDVLQTRIAETLEKKAA
ncbi:MAG: response regulator [Candidatus Eisenbacteria bacterium]|nr:response regulator [Candidatus Eisenbacteria bacterium]